MPAHPARVALLLAVLAAASGAQAGPGGPAPRPVAGRPVDRPDLVGAPLPAELPPLEADSPRDSLLYADRVAVTPEPAELPAGFLPTSVAPQEVTLGADETGTGKPEVFRVQLPPGYDPAGPPRPLLVAYHGFGQSPMSVEQQSTLDEECAVRGWLYLAPTGIDDKLFGSPISQANVEAALLWMIDNHAVDLDRVHMVGFSMGAGIVGNFAARRRDPGGIVVAGLGFVSGSFDWTQTYELDPGIRPWLENPFNFGTSPSLDPFPYQQASTLHLDPASYPPVPGVVDAALTMARNLEHVPVYMTWDVDDSIPELPPQSAALADYLAARGTVQTQPVSGTLDPATGLPATHSWAVLDEAALCDFLAPLTANRVPPTFDALLDGDAGVAFARIVQTNGGAFSTLAGTLDGATGAVTLTTGPNLAEVTVDGAHLDAGWPRPIDALPTSADAPTLRLAGFATPPSYLTDAVSGELVDGLESDPAADALLAPVPAPAGLSVLAHSVPWTAKVSLLPDPAAPGDAVTLAIDAAAGAPAAWLALGVGATLFSVPGGLTLAVPPIVLVAVPLDAAGDATMDATLSSDPGLSGARLLLQAVVVGPAGTLDDASNVFAFDVQ